MTSTSLALGLLLGLVSCASSQELLLVPACDLEPDQAVDLDLPGPRGHTGQELVDALEAIASDLPLQWSQDRGATVPTADTFSLILGQPTANLQVPNAACANLPAAASALVVSVPATLANASGTLTADLDLRLFTHDLERFGLAISGQGVPTVSGAYQAALENENPQREWHLNLGSLAWSLLASGGTATEDDHKSMLWLVQRFEDPNSSTWGYRSVYAGPLLH